MPTRKPFRDYKTKGILRDQQAWIFSQKIQITKGWNCPFFNATYDALPLYMPRKWTRQVLYRLLVVELESESIHVTSLKDAKFICVPRTKDHAFGLLSKPNMRAFLRTQQLNNSNSNPFFTFSKFNKHCQTLYSYEGLRTTKKAKKNISVNLLVSQTFATTK